MMIEYDKKYDLAYKQAIVMYLRQRCAEDPALLEACKKENKSLDGIVTYIKREAQKQEKDGMACIPDVTVYEWAVHYILEDDIDCEVKNDKANKQDAEEQEELDDEEAVEKPVAKEEKPVTIASQLELF